MYKIIGADGKEYGPVSLETLREWAASGRVNGQTRVQPQGAADWRAAAEIPELQSILASLSGAAGAPLPPPPLGATAVSMGAQAGSPIPRMPVPQQQGLSITSLVLGIVSFVFCLGPITGIPAVICGHIALNRTRKAPTQYGGAGLAIAGLSMGYASFVMVFIMAAMLLPALARAKSRAQSINCSNNMKQIGLSFKVWGLDNSDQFPFNVSTNAGGTKELCQRDAAGFDLNGYRHLQVLSNELSTPKILVCPADSKTVAVRWEDLTAGNVTYNVRSGEDVNDTDPQQVLAVCPIHNNILRTDGSVMRESRKSRSTPAVRPD